MSLSTRSHRTSTAAASSSHAMIEPLEGRVLMSASSIPFGPMPAATIGLSARQINRADAVMNWNGTMLRAVWNASTAPTGASRVMAMTGVAVYDAVHGVDPNFELYPVPGLTARPARGSSPEAAAIAAAYTVLSSLYPQQQSMFDDEYQATLAGVRDGNAKSKGIAWGQAVGNAVLNWRSGDGHDAPTTYTPAPPGGPPGQYELTPETTSALDPQWGQVTPWAMTSSTQFQPPPPPALDSAQYAADFNRTKSLGGTVSSTRTADQTQFAHFWADVPGHSVTPPGHWNEIAERLSLQRDFNLQQNARLFGMLNIGLGDAAICCWDAKYLYNFWRPVTAINDPRANSINSATTFDPSWSPLWKTPNFPSYTSGHSTFSGTADAILSSVFGQSASFTIGSDDMPGITRSFSSLSQAANEAGESRVVGGIHFEFDNSAGLSSGRQLGSYISRNFLGRRGDQNSGNGSSPDAVATWTSAPISTAMGNIFATRTDPWNVSKDALDELLG